MTNTTAQPRVRPSSALAWAALVAAVVQVVTPAVQAFAGLGAAPSGQGDELLITPEGYTFSIWSLIYLLTLAYGIVVLATRTTGTAAPDRLLRDLVLLYAGAALWIVVAALEQSWATALVLVAMVVIGVDAARVAARPAPDDGTPSWITVLARVTTGVYAGWVTAAAVLNVCSALVDAGWLDGDSVGWQLAALVFAGVLASAISVLLGGSWPYAAAIVWALIGVMVAVRGVDAALLWAAAAAAVLVVVATAGRRLAGRGRGPS